MALIGDDGKHLWRQRVRQVWLPVAVLAMLAVAALAAGFHWVPVGLAGSIVIVAVVGFLAEPREEVDKTAVRVVPPAPSVVDNAAPLSAALSAIDIPLYLIDRQENIVFQNQAAVSAFGEIGVNQHITARLRSPAVLDCIRETIVSGNVNSVEYSERQPSTTVYQVTVAPVPDVTAVRYYILSFKDISETRRIERMRSDFVANASHELRTPLASLQGFIETLQGPARNDPKAAERFLGIMLEQVQRMNRLVDDLLSLSRIELKAHIAPSEQVELGPLLLHVRDALAPLATDAGVVISIGMPDAPVYVTGDRDELIQVFENLIQNACKYGQEGGKVEVELIGCGDGQGGPQVSIRDYGPGIDAMHLPRLTERFYRVNVEASRLKKGTGLGLAIVKHILTRHRARLLVKSELGKGSVFTVRF